MVKPGNIISTYKRPHHIPNITKILAQCFEIANFAVEYKKQHGKLPTSMNVNYDIVGSHIACQVIRKYGRSKNIKTVRNISAIVNRDGGDDIKYNEKTQMVTIVPLKHYTFKWSPGIPFKQINQIEIKKDMMYIAIEITKPAPYIPEEAKLIGVDLNATGHVAVIANLAEEKVRCFGKEIPKIRAKYQKLRKNAQKHKDRKKLADMSGRETRKVKDQEKKITKKIVDMAKSSKCGIVLEDLTGIRFAPNARRGPNSTKKGAKRRNIINSWSFRRLSDMIIRKCLTAGVPCYKVEPQYTSQRCSYCGVGGERSKVKVKEFHCTQKTCVDKSGRSNYLRVRHADSNAAYNIALRKLRSPLIPCCT